LCMVNGVEKDSSRIGKMKFGLASYADLALGTVTVPAKEHLDRSSKTCKARSRNLEGETHSHVLVCRG
jgi:hypothetical protein